MGEGRASDDDVVVGRRAVVELLRAEGSVERILLAQDAKVAATLTEIRRRAARASVPLRDVPRASLDRYAPGSRHQGVVAFTTSFQYASLEALLESDRHLLFLDGVMDPHNVGSLLRSADGAGFGGIVLPARHAAGITPAARKVAAGAAETVPVARVPNLRHALEQAKDAGLWTIGLDASGALDLWAYDPRGARLALVLGSEDRGLSRGVREVCDEAVRITLAGRLESLNVAVAGAVAMFDFARREAGS